MINIQELKRDGKVKIKFDLPCFKSVPYNLYIGSIGNIHGHPLSLGLSYYYLHSNKLFSYPDGALWLEAILQK